MATRARDAKTQQSDDLTEARAAIAAITPRLVRMIRNSASDGIAVGDWTSSDVACHLAQVVEADTDALAGRPLPASELNPAAVAQLTDAHLAADPERDFAVLAGRVETLVSEFLRVSAAPAREEVTWLGGIRMPASAAACHLLEELLVHGFDIATGTNQTWPIDPAHAALAITGAAVPIVNAAGPTAFARPNRAPGPATRVEVRLRGHGSFTVIIDEGVTFAEGSSGPIDARVSAEPTTMLLLMLGRIGHARPILRGRIAVWGRRPWRVRRLLTSMSPP